MKCPKCGSSLDPFATKCPTCGPMNSAPPPKPAPKPAAPKPARKVVTGTVSSKGGGVSFLDRMKDMFSSKKKQPVVITTKADVPTADEMPEDSTRDDAKAMTALKPHCTRCNKILWAPHGNESPDEMVQHSMSRAMFCVWCQHTYCKQCAFEAGRKKGQNAAMCPKCGKTIT